MKTKMMKRAAVIAAFAMFSFAQAEESVDYSSLELVKTFDFNPQLTGWNTEYVWGRENLSDVDEQYYAENEGNDTFLVENGVLGIMARGRSENAPPGARGKPYSSGVISSHGNFSQLHGYFEARIKLPVSQGVWPVFMLVPDQASSDFYSELTVMESTWKTLSSKAYYASIHVPDSGKIIAKGDLITVDEELSDFQTYGVHWSESYIKWYFNGMLVMEAETPDNWDVARHIAIGMAVGGWAGTPGEEDLPATMLIDYVSVYRDKPEEPVFVSEPVVDFKLEEVPDRAITFNDVIRLLEALRDGEVQ